MIKGIGRAAVSLGITLLLLALGLALIEGVGALCRGRQLEPSLTLRTLIRLGWADPIPLADDENASQVPDADALPLLDGHYVTSEEQLVALAPDFQRADVLLGNTPFSRLATPSARITRDDPALGLMLKPNLHIETGILKTLLYSPWDPVTYSLPASRRSDLSPAARSFLDTYGFNRHELRTDDAGFRVTLPTSAAPRIILVVGDSVGFGLGVPDADTLPSQLQKRWGAGIRVINACVPGADTTMNLARLRHLIDHPPGQLAGLIYVHCENDYKKGATAADVVTPLADIADGARLPYRVLVSQQYLPRALPDVFRSRLRKVYLTRKPELDRLAAARGFTVIDTTALVEERCRALNSRLGGADFYVDHCHFSALGLEHIAQRVPDPPAP